MSYDPAYQDLLLLRPTNVVHQLGSQSQTPLLNARHIFDGMIQLAERAGVLWAPTVTLPGMAGGILRAAAHQKALVGLSLQLDDSDPGVLKRDRDPFAFVQAAVAAADNTDRVCPFFLHVEAPPLLSASGADFEAVRNHLLRCQEAGFTSFGVDLSQCEGRACAALALGLLESTQDLELGLTVRVGWESADAEPKLVAEQIAAVVTEIKREGLLPDLILIPESKPGSPGAWDLAALVSPMIGPSSLAWCDSDHIRSSDLGRLLPTGVRALVGGQRLATAASPDPDRLEALSYGKAMTTIAGLGGRNLAPRLVPLLLPS